MEQLSMSSAEHGWRSLGEVERLGSLAAGIGIAAYGLSRRTATGAWVAVAAMPLVYRGVMGRELGRAAGRGETRVALGGRRGVRVREAVRIERPVPELYRFWRDLSNLPKFMTNLESVTDQGGGRSHWVAAGPAGTTVEWDAEIINEVEQKVIGWRSLPGADVVSAGSVTFDRARGGQSTQITVSLQYSPPAGRAGRYLAWILGREPSQTIREDLRRLKQLLEAGEVAVAQANPRVAAGGW